MNTQTIAAEFHCFYASLYNIPLASPNGTDGQQVDRIETYLRESGLPTLPTSVLEELEFPVTIEELSAAIVTPPPHKSAGPDGLTNVY